VRIEQLEYVAAVTRHGSLRRAGEQLHLSQPALSEAITRLERELGVTLLDRRRSGARISREGRDLLPLMSEVLEAVARLRTAAGDRSAGTRVVRLGTVNAATSHLLVPAVQTLQRRRPEVNVEVVDAQQAEIDLGLVEGTLDLGLVNLLDGDDEPVGLECVDLLHGRPVVVLPAGHPLAEQDEVAVEQLRAERFVAMRSGYLMHRFVHRLLGGDMPTTCHTTDGAEMGKAMVADGLGVTVLPDFSVTGDPFERAGLLLTRPIAGDTTTVTLQLRHRRTGQVSSAARDLRDVLVAHARA
jgi:DNA-binding transcriptional LysR family regulator